MTEDQKELLRWLVQQVYDGKLSEEFYVYWTTDTKVKIIGHQDGWIARKIFQFLVELDSLVLAGMLQCIIDYVVILTTRGQWEQREESRKYRFLDTAYQAVDEEFSSLASDLSKEGLGATILSS